MSEPPIRILYINPIAILGGAEKLLLQLMLGLDRNRFQPILLTPEPGLLTDLFKQSGLEVIFVSTFPVAGSPVRNTYQSLLLNSVKIARIIRQMDVKIVHSNSPRAAYHGGLAGRWAGISTVTHVHECHGTPFRSRSKSLFLDAISDRLICVSRAVEAVILASRPSLAGKTSIIHSGITPPVPMSAAEIQDLKTEIGISNRFPVLAIIGAITDLKGQHIILKAMPEILQIFPQACLLVVGGVLSENDNEYQQKLISLVGEQSLENAVVFTGFRRDIPRIMASIDLMAHVPIFPDAFPTVLLEAGNYGIPVVASDIGGIGEIVVDGVTGRLVPPANPGNLAATVIEMLSDRDKLTQMGASSRVHIQLNFPMERYINGIRSIYQQLLDRV